MKAIVLILLVLVSSRSCSEDKDFADAVIEYKAQTRGYQQQIEISNKMIWARTDKRGEKKAASRTLTEAEQKSLLDAFSGIDLEKVPYLEAPSKKHQYDGAAAATLIITFKSQTYQTPTFDHNNPPQELSALIERMRQLASTEDNEY